MKAPKSTGEGHELRLMARQLYVNGRLTIAEIEAELGVTRSQIYGWIEKYNWPRRQQRKSHPKPKVRDAAVISSPKKAKRRSGSVATDCPDEKNEPVDPDTLLSRLYRAIERNLGQLEQQMSDGSIPTAADGERNSRAIGVIARSLEKMNELHQEREKFRRQSETDDDARDETEQLRLALAERILKLKEQHQPSDNTFTSCTADPDTDRKDPQ